VPAECRHANEGGLNENTESGGARTQSPPDLLARQTPINAPPVGCRAQVTYIDLDRATHPFRPKLSVGQDSGC
jgi:hypothetical protein